MLATQPMLRREAGSPRALAEILRCVVSAHLAATTTRRASAGGQINLHSRSEVGKNLRPRSRLASISVAGMRNRQAMTDQGAKAGHEFCLTAVELSPANRCGEFVFVGKS